MGMVSEKVITKLGVEPPSHQMVDSYMAIIAENYNVPYERDPTAAFVSFTNFVSHYVCHNMSSNGSIKLTSGHQIIMILASQS